MYPVQPTRARNLLSYPVSPEFLLLFFFFFLFFFSLLSSLELSDTKVYEPYIRARLGDASHLCKGAVLKLRTPPRQMAAVSLTLDEDFDRVAEQPLARAALQDALQQDLARALQVNRSRVVWGQNHV